MDRLKTDPVPWWTHEPVLSLCGWSGSGKTTVLEAVIPRLVARGLRVAAVKHDAHGIQIDRRGKDSDRLFRAGASVHLRGPGELVWRIEETAEDGLAAAVVDLLRNHDLVLVEGHKRTPLPKVWCEPEDGASPPPDIEHVREVLPWSADRVEALETVIDQRIEECAVARPVYGGVMMGGGSRRMGQPKHALTIHGQSMLSRCIGAIEPLVSRVVLLGAGTVPDDVCCHARLVDAPGVGEGPLAAAVTAFRWAPACSWLFAACDMPLVSREAISWLLEHRRPGRWAVVPQRSDGHLEPLLALYEPQAAWLFSDQLQHGRRALHHTARHQKFFRPVLPASMEPAWTNINTPEDLALFRS